MRQKTLFRGIAGTATNTRLARVIAALRLPSMSHKNVLHDSRRQYTSQPHVEALEGIG